MFITFVVSALCLGCVYGLIALGYSTIYNRLKLGGYGIEIHRACHNKHIGIYYFLQYLCHIVLTDTGSVMLRTIITSFSRGYFLSRNTDFFYFVTCLLCSTHKFIA